MEKEIKYLEEQIKLLNQIVETQKELIKALQNPTIINTVPFTTPVGFYCEHEYPNPWMSILPPHCKKCGMPANGPYIYTISGNSSASI